MNSKREDVLLTIIILQAIPADLQRKSKAVGIVSDVDDGTGPDEDLPEATKAGVIDVAKDADGKPVAGEDSEENEAPFSRTGWSPRLGWPVDNEEESLLDHTTWVETKLPDHLYGGEFILSRINIYHSYLAAIQAHARQTCSQMRAIYFNLSSQTSTFG